MTPDPVVLPRSPGGDFPRLVGAALRLTAPGSTVTPEEIAGMIGASPASTEHIRACAADLLAYAVPLHRLQELDGTSPIGLWAEDIRRAILMREAAIGVD
jgi:O6-methylguanine-DNA--protein-cysteine methyltransferase